MSKTLTTVGSEFKRILRQPAFLVSFGVLLVAAVSLNGVTNLLRLHFRKQPVPLRKELTSLPDRFGSWVCVAKEENLGDEMEAELGTKQFIFRDFVDTRLVNEDQIKRFNGQSLKRQRELLADLRKEYPTGVINCAVTYYTGKADTVAHIPDRCYIASGYQIKDYEDVKWDADTPASRGGAIPARLISFQDGDERSKSTTFVSYFFHTDGEYVADPVAVRVKMQNLFKPYAYYAKMEVWMPLEDKKACMRQMNDFIKSAVREVEPALPDYASLAVLEGRR